ncbi:MAG TPA: patatin-like phospholipase family protein [Candidatus Sulfotelmatobacter sp.]|jgi:NTE family protein|nr:patatin-like phospholipase family protein [Candidatus Sulfotelmatobacter sp.]
MLWRTPIQTIPAYAGPFAAPTALGLQGGGAYGAFSWGVLDRLLEEDDLPLGAISGASAGAVNATVAAWGLLESGRPGAREALRRLWDGVGKLSAFSPLGLPGADMSFDLMTRVLSPYQFNPLNVNPLRDLLAGMIDFDRLKRDCPLPLFIATTHVPKGDVRIFRESEISLDVLMASACIPYIHQAVEMDGEPYWDGGFSSNPPLLPMVTQTDCRSLLVVKLTPDEEPGAPTAAPEIFARLKRILFNAPLMREMDAIAEIQRVVAIAGRLPPELARLRDLEIHSLSISPDFFVPKGSALDPKPQLLERLFEAGRASADGLILRAAHG